MYTYLLIAGLLGAVGSYVFLFRSKWMQAYFPFVFLPSLFLVFGAGFRENKDGFNWQLPLIIILFTSPFWVPACLEIRKEQKMEQKREQEELDEIRSYRE